jgi:polysaccharide export outer membrane protein
MTDKRAQFNLHLARFVLYPAMLLILASAPLFPQAPAVSREEFRADGSSGMADYILGPEDTLLIRAQNVDELGTLPYPVDLQGFINIPLAGRLQAAGLTVSQLEAAISRKLNDYLQNPDVTVTVAEYRSQPISVLGQVGSPGVHQLRGRKTLFEVISEAGGFKPEAGNTIQITRQKRYGTIPLPDARRDSTGEFSVAEVRIRELMEARNPAENIPIKPYDVITVPKAQLIYVIGSVKRSGGFILSERPNMSILQALAMAEGLDRTAATDKAQIIRQTGDAGPRTEIPVDVKKILKGKAPDVPLVANDILFIPDSAAKGVAYRTFDAIIQAGTGAAVYRPF